MSNPEDPSVTTGGPGPSATTGGPGPSVTTGGPDPSATTGGPGDVRGPRSWPARTVLVAELSANHQGDLERAKDTLHAMQASGADWVKLQTYRPESLALDLDGPHFGPRTSGPWAGLRPFDLYTRGALPLAWHAELFALAAALGMTCFSSPFDEQAVDFLEQLGCPCYKVASLEITHVPLLERIAATGAPVILSTGAATLGDIELALDTLGRERSDITLLKCTTAYPTPFAEVNLRSMVTLGTSFGLPVGLSDHTLGHTVAVAAVALGARLIEKHFILERAHGGPDAAFSMEPAEFRALVDAVRATEDALGSERYVLAPSSAEARLRGRSIFVSAAVAAGEPLSEANVRIVRPGAGLHPRHLRAVLGRRAREDLAPGTPLAWQHVSAPDD